MRPLSGPFKEHLHALPIQNPWSRVAWLQQRPGVIALLEVERGEPGGRGLGQVPVGIPPPSKPSFSPLLTSQRPRDYVTGSQR